MLCHNSSFMYLKTATLKPLQSLTREGNWNYFNRQFQILYLIFFLGWTGGFYFFFPWFNWSWYIVGIHSRSVCYAVVYCVGSSNHRKFLLDSFCKVCFWMSVFFWGFWTCLCAVTRTYCNVFALSKFLDLLSCIALPILSWNILDIYQRTVKT